MIPVQNDRNLAARGRRRRAAAVAGHRHDADTARAFLQDEDGSVRAIALSALLRSHALTSDDLADAATDPDPRVRSRVAQTVAALRGQGVAGLVSLLDLLDDPDPQVVESAAWASGEREPPEDGAVERLVELACYAEDALVREAAVASLGAIGDPAGLPAILAGTGDRATVRRRAVLALAPFDGPEVEAALSRALADRDWQVRQAAEDLTGRPGVAPS